MKAKVKGTNEIVEVKPNGTSKTIHMNCSEFVSEDGRVFPSIYLDIINEVDWEARRYEIAKDAMQGVLSNPAFCNTYTNKDFPIKIAIYSADKLIEELKKTKKK
ncbi:hypothetical protein [Phocaeicola plebeius]|uniref:hypothetical protein n=1 Tax=Phocaeicola plebeius TaxID=310297 RepID=UPI003FF0D036